MTSTIVNIGIIDMTLRRFKFSSVRCQKLAPPPTNSSTNMLEYTDTEVKGLKFAVAKSGQRAFYYRGTYRKEKICIRLGSFPGMQVEDARKKARSCISSLERGIDPRVEVNSNFMIPTLEAFVIDDYLPYLSKSKRSFKIDKSRLMNSIIPKFGRKRLDELTTHELECYLADIATNQSNATSNRYRSLISSLYTQANKWQKVSINPCSAIKKLKENPPPARFFNRDEMTKIVAALEIEANTHAAAALMFLIFTGLRLNEALFARWEYFDADLKQLHLPTTKAGKSRYVPLNKNAMMILFKQQKCAKSPWIFPGKDPSKPLTTPRKAWCRALENAGVSYGRIHDIRHSFASFCVESGASLYAVQHLLGHASPNTTQRYAHFAQDTLRNVSTTAMQSFMQNGD